MKTLKGWITTTCLVAMLMVSTMTANAGIIIAGAVDPCTDSTTAKTGKLNSGIIIAGLTGIIIAGFTGIIIAGGTSTEVPTESCGIIIAG
ncbi:MAG: hypothetical protein DMF63_10915 [Acidobacteria bacterium]|nr:MAG: hypothetical protein DMF63_10915 [Acidobacteriota bacterium]